MYSCVSSSFVSIYNGSDVLMAQSNYDVLIITISLMWLYGLYIVMHQWVSDCYHGSIGMRREEEKLVSQNDVIPCITMHLPRSFNLSHTCTVIYANPFGRNKTSDAFNTTFAASPLFLYLTRRSREGQFTCFEMGKS